jgi:acyl-CoA thioesterase FadM
MTAPDGEAVCAAKTVIVSIEPASGRAVPVPDAVRARLQQFAV